MKFHTLILLFTICFSLSLSCQNIKKSELRIETKLEKKEGLGPFKRMLKPFRLLDSIPTFIKNIPEYDSMAVSVLSLGKKRGIDMKVKNYFYAITGYKNNSQYVIVDTDNDYDFNDEEEFKCDKNLKFEVRKNKDLRATVPVSKIRIENGDESDVFNSYYYVRVLPYYKYSNPIRDYVKENYKLVGEMTEHIYGEFHYNSEKYKVAVTENVFKGIQALIAKKDELFSRADNHQYLPFAINDKIKLDKDYFIIEDIDLKDSKVVFKHLDSNSQTAGFRIKDHVNLEFLDMNSKKTIDINQLLAERPFLLLDFWGTWCAPCIELTPNIKSISESLSNKLNILSIAFDLDEKKVQNYISKSEMNWYHYFLEGYAKSSKNQPELIKELRITTYPTFILLDANSNILYRGIGSEALSDIELIVGSY